MAKSIIERLADHVEEFSCRANNEKLMFYSHPSSSWPWRTNRHGTHVGTVRKEYENHKIVSLTDDAPDYLKPLVGVSFARDVYLYAAIRRAAFLNEVRQILGELLETTKEGGI